MNSNFDLINEAIKSNNIIEIAKILNVSAGTINRWILLKNVPSSYEFELLKLLNKDIDYSLYSSKVKDQFFTPLRTSHYCFEVFKKLMISLGEDINNYTFIEPSAGDGSFMSVLPKNSLALDIEPQNKNIKKQDYLSWIPPNKDKYIIFGNPPFGLRGHLALKFMNHSTKFADFICFILPPLFESDGKGSPRKRVKDFNLIHSEKLDSKFYEPNKSEVTINTIFQVWSKNHNNEIYTLEHTKNTDISIYSLSNGDTASSKRNIKMIEKCDIYLPSTCFGKKNMTYYTKFNELPNKRGYGLVFNKNKNILIDKVKKVDWTQIAFLSTNSALNLRTSQIVNILQKV